jgi:hypothetical protein
MKPSAPLYVTVEIKLLDGPSSGERRFRLSELVELPPRLCFGGSLPIEGEARGEVSFQMPGGGPWLKARAQLSFDPEHPEQGTSADLIDPAPEMLHVLEAYIENPTKTTTKRTTQ